MVKTINHPPNHHFYRLYKQFPNGHCFTMFYLHCVFMTLIFPGPEDREVFQDWTEGVRALSRWPVTVGCEQKPGTHNRKTWEHHWFVCSNGLFQRCLNHFAIFMNDCQSYPTVIVGFGSKNIRFRSKDMDVLQRMWIDKPQMSPTLQHDRQEGWGVIDRNAQLHNMCHGPWSRTWWILPYWRTIIPAFHRELP